MILKLRAALEYPTFPVNCWVFRVLEERLAAIFACRTKHGTRWVAQETFLKTYVLVTGHPQSYLRTQGIWHYLLADWDQVTQEISRDIEKEWDESRRVKQCHLLLFFSKRLETWTHLYRIGRTCSQNCTMEAPRYSTSELHFGVFQTQSTSNVGKSTLAPMCAQTHRVPSSKCRGAQKWR